MTKRVVCVVCDRRRKVSSLDKTLFKCKVCRGYACGGCSTTMVTPDSPFGSKYESECRVCQSERELTS